MSNRDDIVKRDAEANMAYYDRQSAEFRRWEWGDDYYAAENLRRKRRRPSTSSQGGPWPNWIITK